MSDNIYVYFIMVIIFLQVVVIIVLLATQMMLLKRVDFFLLEGSRVSLTCNKPQCVMFSCMIN